MYLKTIILECALNITWRSSLHSGGHSKNFEKAMKKTMILTLPFKGLCGTVLFACHVN